MCGNHLVAAEKLFEVAIRWGWGQLPLNQQLRADHACSIFFIRQVATSDNAGSNLPLYQVRR